MILITGSTGFIGQHLCSYLKDKNLKFIPFSRKIVKLRYLNMFTVKFIDFSLDKPKYPKVINADTMIHLASIAHDTKNKFKKSDYTKTNEKSLDLLLKWCRKAKIKRFIYISSVGVYGDIYGKKISVKSKENPTEIYSLSKLNAEKKIINFCKKNNIEFVIIRPPLVYAYDAPGNFKRLIKLFSNNYILPFGNSKSEKTVIYVKNLCDFIYYSISSNNVINKKILITDNHRFSLYSLNRMLVQKGLFKNLLIPINDNILIFCSYIFCKGKVVKKMLSGYKINGSNFKDWKPKYSLNHAISEIADKYNLNNV